METSREELKNKALLETIGKLEEEKADLRVELTIYSQAHQQVAQRNQELENEVASLRASLSEFKTDDEPVVVKGSLVGDEESSES